MIRIVNENASLNLSGRELSLLTTGQGLFETILYSGGQLCFWREHSHRLQEGLNYFNAQMDWPPLPAIIDKYIRLQGWKESRVKITVLFPFDFTPKELGLENVIVQVWRIRPTKAGHGGGRLRLMPAPYRDDYPLGRLKTINYGARFHDVGSVKKSGFTDILYHDSAGNILEASTANIFAVKDDMLFTPPLQNGLLQGTVRIMILRRLKAREKQITVHELGKYDFFFLTSSVKELRTVKQINDLKFSVNNLQFEKIQREWRRIKRYGQK